MDCGDVMAGGAAMASVGASARGDAMACAGAMTPQPAATPGETPMGQLLDVLYEVGPAGGRPEVRSRGRPECRSELCGPNVANSGIDRRGRANLPQNWLNSAQRRSLERSPNAAEITPNSAGIGPNSMESAPSRHRPESRNFRT